MNELQKSMKNIQASEELKQNTLRLLYERRRNRFPSRRILQSALAAACLFLFLGAAGLFVYQKPVSYISIDINPSIELGINRFGKVVSASAYNEEGQDILSHVALKNSSYLQAVSSLLQDEVSSGFLSEDSALIFTVISDSPYTIIEALRTTEVWQTYGALAYTADVSCMGEAHRNEMSFGKYRAYLELTQYDSSVTIEDCHSMSIGEIHDRIDGCRNHHETEFEEETYPYEQPTTHGNHHKGGH